MCGNIDILRIRCLAVSERPLNVVMHVCLWCSTPVAIGFKLVVCVVRPCYTLLTSSAGVLRAQRAQLQPAVAAQAAVQQHRQRLPAAGPPHPHQRALRGPPLAGAAAQRSQGPGVRPLDCTKMQRCRQSMSALFIESACQTQLQYAAGSPIWWSCARHGAGTWQLPATAAGTSHSHTHSESVQHALRLAVTCLASLPVISNSCACCVGR